MAKSFNNLSETSAGFVMLVNESGIYMDVKYILLNVKSRKMFRMEHMLYLMVINSNKTNRINIGATFQAFVIENASISRAFFYKVLQAMVKSGMVSKLDKRGWYRINFIKKELI